MSWQERLKGSAYTAPDGTRIEFKTDDISRSFEKKTTAFEFPDVEGTFVQDNGSSGLRYPVQAYFIGENCDTEADTFERLLRQNGVGRLELPLYKTVDVVPTGSVDRSDAIKTAANITRVNVTFFETILLIYPKSQTDPESEVIGGVTDATEALGNELADGVDFENPSALATFKSKITVLVESVQAVIGQAQEIKAQVMSKVSEVLTLVDTLGTGDSKNTLRSIADSLLDLMATPSQLQKRVKDKFSDYSRTIDSLLNFAGSQSDFYATKAVTDTMLGGLIISIVNSELDTQGGAVEVAENLLELQEKIVAWEDESRKDLSIVDTGETYQQIQESVALTAGYLVQISFTLKRERKIVVTRNRSIVDLAAELYGQVDEALDFFINSNQFTGAEILEVPAGREVVYYV